MNKIKWFGSLYLFVCLSFIFANNADFTEFSIEDLMNIEVSSVSKKEQSLSDIPVAVYIITKEDIRRSGHHSIPEILRMVPGMQVARIDSNKWAITSRGFNTRFANKLLVMVDGRSVYTPLFAGVYWDIQDVIIDDIERIEVIRGPGASIWGANAVNGVINIITVKPSDDQGGVVSVVAGNEEKVNASICYADQIKENLFYRANIKYFEKDAMISSPNQSSDGWDQYRLGFHVENIISEDLDYHIDMEYYQGDVEESGIFIPLFTPPFFEMKSDILNLEGGYISGKIHYQIDEEQQISIQSYFDVNNRDSLILNQDRKQWNFEINHQWGWSEKNELIWGGGVRWDQLNLGNTAAVEFHPEDREDWLYNIFVQNEFEMMQDQVWLTTGIKLEENDYTGFEYQPTGRIYWKCNDKHSFWGSISRAIRTPSRAEEDAIIYNGISFSEEGVPVYPRLTGDSQASSEELLAYELGHRWNFSESLYLDQTVFLNQYDQLRSLEPRSFILQSDPLYPYIFMDFSFENNLNASIYGYEFSGFWQPFKCWRTKFNYSLIRLDFDLEKNSIDFNALDGEKTSPQHQFNIASFLDLPFHLKWNTSLYYVDSITTERTFNQGVIPSYIRWDMNMIWNPTTNWEMMIGVQNILDNQHSEFINFLGSSVEIQRSYYGKIRWLF